MAYLQNKFPALKQLSSCSLAVNECYVQGAIGLKTGDEVAIIPPVSGG
jgi:molybdopterin converting factor small subunit